MATLPYMILCQLIRLTDFELEAKTRILDQISSKIWPLTPTGRGPFLENFKKAFTSLFVWSSRLIVPIFVYLGLAGTERQAKTLFQGEIRSNFELWPLQMGSNLHILKKTPLQACSQHQVASRCQFLSILDQPVPNEKPKREFGGKLGQILT